MTWSKSGTVSVVQNSNAVIGTGTAFLASGHVGDAFIGPDGGLYEVTNIASDTAMSISPNYRGATNSAGSYALAPMQGYNKATADALREASLQVGDALGGLEESVAEAAESAATATAAKNAAQSSATAAAESASAADTSKSNAATSATGAANSATAANASKVAAALSESSAATSATNSANSATAAAASASTAAAIVSSRNLLVNGNFSINQRGYVSATATTVANQYTLDRWRVVTSGQSIAYSASGTGNQITAPAGGVEQPVIAENIWLAGAYTLRWVGTATATINGAAVIKGGQVTLPANTNAIVRFAGGTVSEAQLEAGGVTTAFERLRRADHLFNCQYYGYALSPSVAGQPVCSVTFTYSNYLAVGTLKFPRALRVNPTASFLAGSPASFTVTGGGGGGIALDNLQVAAIGKESCFLGASISTSFVIGYGTLLSFVSSPNLFFSAEV